MLKFCMAMAWPNAYAWNRRAFDTHQLQAFFNTVVVGFTSSVLALILGATAAYALVRFQYHRELGRSSQVNLLDTCVSLMVVYVTGNLPFVIWIMRDYFQTVPLELEESAAIDGGVICSTGGFTAWLISEQV